MNELDERVLYLDFFKDNGISLTFSDCADSLTKIFQNLVEHRGDNNIVPAYLLFYSIGSIDYFGYNIIDNHVYSCGRINFCQYLSTEDQNRLQLLFKKLMLEKFGHKIKTVALKRY